MGGIKRKHVCFNVANKLELTEKLQQSASDAPVCKIYKVKKKFLKSVNQTEN